MPDAPQPTEAVKVFYSYSHKDEELRDSLETHLALLRRLGVVSSWHDRRITASREWEGEIDKQMKAADIILLLVSADFLDSDYCYDVELGQAMRQHEAKKSRVIPVTLRPCDLTGAPFDKLNSLPTDGVPVTKWQNRDDAFTDIAKGIRRAAEEIAAERRINESAHGVATEAENARTDGAESRAASLIPRPPVVGFVARRDEQGRDIVRLLREELAPEKSQLVALWGPGGTGKTTLAAEVVRATRDMFKGRVAWASSLQRADFNLAILLDEIATQLGYANLRTLAPEPKLAQVGWLVGLRPTLIVLDNFETIAGPEQLRCLDFLSQNAACPAVITTRSRINRDEVYNVPLAAMTMEEARVLLQRLAERTRRPGTFDKLDRDELIRQCEANPLVLQWVVSQIDLARRPEDVLRYLSWGEGDAAERVFLRSFDLPQLGDDARVVLLALSLFTPDASREALADVSGVGSDLRRLEKAIEGLSALWLIETTEGNERLFLRGLTRELAKSRLSNDARADNLRRGFVAYFLRYAEAHAQPTPEDYDALEEEKDNLLSATDMVSALGDWESVVLMADALAHPGDGMLNVRGYWDEALRVGDLALRSARSLHDEKQIAAVAHNVGVMYKVRGESDRARRLYGESLNIKEGLGDRRGIAVTNWALGNIALEQGDNDEAKRLFQDSLGTFRDLQDDGNAAGVLHELGRLAQAQGEMEEARRLYVESLEIKKRFGYQRRIAVTLHELGRLARAQARPKEARRLYKESLQIKETFGDYSGKAITLHALANLSKEEGALTEARRLYNESLEITNNLGDKRNLAIISFNLALLEEQEGNKTEAARLLGDALQILQELGSPLAERARKRLARMHAEAS